MHAITRAHASTRAPSLMCVKNGMCHLCLNDTYCLGHWNKENEGQKKTPNFARKKSQEISKWK